MNNPLTEAEREELLAEVTEAHNVVSKLARELRSRYSHKAAAVKAAAKAERDLFQLKRAMQKMDLNEAPGKPPLPVVKRGGRVVDVEKL